MASLDIVPGKGGVYEVDVDDVRLFSKKESGRHAAPGEVMTLVREHLARA